MVVIRIACERADNLAGVSAREYLRWVTEEQLICCAAVCEAASHGMVVLRFFDSSMWDPSAITPMLQEYVAKIRLLFIRGKCKEMGYVHHVIQLLQKPILIPKKALGWTVSKTIGGIDLGPALDRMMRKMGCWCALTIEAAGPYLCNNHITNHFLFTSRYPTYPLEGRSIDW